MAAVPMMRRPARAESAAESDDAVDGATETVAATRSTRGRYKGSMEQYMNDVLIPTWNKKGKKSGAVLG